MASPPGLGIAHVALTVQVAVVPEKLDALLRESDKTLGMRIARMVHAWVREQTLGYYPALEFLVDQGVVPAEDFETLRTLSATIRKRIKRDVQSQLWPIFSSVHIERTQTLAFLLPRLSPSRPGALEELAAHYFPNVVRLELLLSSLDKSQRLEDVTSHTETKVMRHLLDHFATVSVSATRRVDPPRPD